MKLAKSLERLGTESAFSVLAEAKKLEAQGKPMIHLGLGQPDFKTPKHVVEAAKKALDDGHHGYVLSNGILECRQSVTRKIKKLYNQDIDPERIIIMPGGKPTMHYAIQCFGEPGVEIILDGGIRRGTHVLKALAAGATACSFGKMFLFSLGAGGQAGVERLLQNMHDEINRNMVLMGCKNIKELNRTKLIYRK